MKFRSKNYLTSVRSSIHDTRYTIRDTRAFSLIELLVVAAIMVIVTALTLVNNSRFGGVVLLQNLAYDIALSVRQAQTYGISVRNAGSGNFNVLYGMHFEKSEWGATHYQFYADTSNPPTGAYVSGQGEEVVPAYVIGRGYYIADLCATPGGGTETCGVSKLDIVFKRPEPDAHITAGDGTGETCIQNPDVDHCKESARIIVASPRGDMMSIVVGATGQISVPQGIQ